MLVGRRIQQVFTFLSHSIVFVAKLRRQAIEVGPLYAENQRLLPFIPDIERRLFLGEISRRRDLLLYFFRFLHFTISTLLVAFGHLISSNVMFVVLSSGRTDTDVSCQQKLCRASLDSIIEPVFIMPPMASISDIPAGLFGFYCEIADHDRRCITSRASNRVPASDDGVDHFGDGPVPFHFEFGAKGVHMGRRGVTKHPHDLMLRQQPAIVQGKQERLADR